jgi:hypothetical protein
MRLPLDPKERAMHSADLPQEPRRRQSGGARHRPSRAIALVLVVAGGVVFGALALLTGFENAIVKQGEGLLIDHPAYKSTPAVELRFFGAFSVLAHPAYANLQDADIVGALLLAAIATSAATGLLVLRAADVDGSRLSVFLLLSALGCGYLALDELLGVHETVGFNMLFLADIPGVTYADDPLFGLYTLAALAVFVAFRDVIWASRPAALLLGAGVAFTVGAGVVDLWHITSDEPFELVANLLLLAGFFRLVVDRTAAAVASPDALKPAAR